MLASHFDTNEAGIAENDGGDKLHNAAQHHAKVSTS